MQRKNQKKANKQLRFRYEGKQYEMLQALHSNKYEEIGGGGAGGGGKSYLGVFNGWHMCWKYPGIRWFFGRKTLKDLKRTTLKTYYKFCSDYEIPAEQCGKFDHDSSTIIFSNGSEIVCLDLAYQPSDPECNWLGSFEFTGGFIDESPQIDKRVIDVLYSRINRHMNEKYGIKGFIFEVGNPDKGHFYHRFYARDKNGKMPEDCIFIKATAIDRLIHPDYFRAHKKLHEDDAETQTGRYIRSLQNRTEKIQQRLLWGNFEYDESPDKLIEIDEIYAAFEDDLVPGGDRYITADIAGRGSDLYVIIYWEGFRIVEVQEHAKTTGKKNVEIINNLKNKYKVPNRNICYDADGIGGGIDGWFNGAKEFLNGSKPMGSDEYGDYFRTLADQCSWIMIDLIKGGFVYLNSRAFKDRPLEYVANEIDQQRHVNHDKDEPKKLTPKDVIKANLGRSPDYWDAIKMRARFEVSDKPEGFFLVV